MRFIARSLEALYNPASRMGAIVSTRRARAGGGSSVAPAQAGAQRRLRPDPPPRGEDAVGVPSRPRRRRKFRRAREGGRPEMLSCSALPSSEVVEEITPFG